MTDAPKGKTLVVRLTSPTGIASLIQCEEGETSGELRPETRLHLEKSEQCFISVLIKAEAFQGFGSYQMTISAK